MTTLPQDSMDWLLTEAMGLVDTCAVLAKSEAAHGLDTVDDTMATLFGRWDIVADATTKARAGNLTPRGGVVALAAMMDMARLAYRLSTVVPATSRTDYENEVVDVAEWRASTWGEIAGSHPDLVGDAIRNRDSSTMSDSPADELAMRSLLTHAAQISAAALA
jgi:hypothetical protein